MLYRILFYTIAGTILLHACQGKAKPKALDPANVTRVELVEKSFDFGDIKQGEIVGHTFRVKNTGEKNLFLLDIESSCGCTTANYTTKPVKPGDNGIIEVKFDSSGKYGKQYKVVHVSANTSQRNFELVVKANIVARDE
ncbi:MAG: DUF1573 domain-containing protein [Odoribacteraceae bacterium]|jgi:hypothetical protein|nr:DUF1573 domain-containing protein [Odoribacteraceae bacterium]